MRDSKAVRAVFDTNVLIDSAWDHFSAPARLLERVIEGDIEAVATRAVMGEYRMIMQKLLAESVDTELLEGFLERVTLVEPSRADVHIDDKEDQKFIAAAVGGSADRIITSDRHLLDVGEVEAIRIVNPTEAWTEYSDSNNTEWHAWAKGLGIGETE